MTLGVCMIVKNEIEVLERALLGVKDIADEIVIVDTGSCDGTVEKAREFTDKVYYFKWRDDFAAARNFALSKLASDYWMWLDADDIVPPTTAAAIKKLMRGKPFDAAMLPYVLTQTPSGAPDFSYYRERIIKNSPEFYWQGRVHEAVTVFGNVVRLDAPVIHGKPATRRTGTRNLDIYKKMLAGGQKLTPRETYYYARELFYNGYTEQAAQAFTDFLVMPDGFYVNKVDACIMLSSCYGISGNTELALAAAYRSFCYGLPTGEACCRLGELYFASRDYRAAAYWYDRALHAKPDIGSGAFVNGECYSFIPLVWLSVCYDRMGNVKKAFRYHARVRRIRPDHPSVVANTEYFRSLGYE